MGLACKRADFRSLKGLQVNPGSAFACLLRALAEQPCWMSSLHRERVLVLSH